MALERAIGQVMINALLGEGLGSNAIIRALRSAGASYRRADMLSDIRDFAGRAKYEANVLGLNRNTVIPGTWMSETELNIPYKYRVFGNADILDDETGDVFRTTKSFYTDDLAEVGDWENEFISAAQESYSMEGQSITNFQVKSVQHNEGYPF